MLKINKIYLAGIFIILALPLLSFPPWFFPPDWAKNMVFRIVMLIMLALFLWQFLYKRGDMESKPVVKNKIIWLLLALVVIYFLSSIFSLNPYFSIFGSPIRAAGLLNFVFYVIFAVFAFLTLRNQDYKKLWIFSIIIGSIICIGALVQYYSLFNKFIVSASFRPSSTIGNPIFLGIYLLILLFPAISLLIQEKRLVARVLYCLYIILSLYVILITGSRAAYLGCLAGLLFFVLLYPKKLPWLKSGVMVLVILTVVFVGYINTVKVFPKFLEDSRLFGSTVPRLRIGNVVSEARFPAWAVAMKVFAERPVLGWGMENFDIGFNKYYDPSIENEWWDKPHNILLQTATEGGIFALATYVALFVFLLWKLQKLKKEQGSPAGRPIFIHGIQAMLIAYLVANLFSIDAYPTYILFFFAVAHVMTLAYPSQATADLKRIENKNGPGKHILFGSFLIIAIAFLWQYHLVPLWINKTIVNAHTLAGIGACEPVMNDMEAIMAHHTFLDGYARLRYVELIKDCSVYDSQNLKAYVQKGILLLQEAARIQPLYPRTYLYLGTFKTILAFREPDENTKNQFIGEAEYYFQKADELAPNHQEIFYERTKLDIVKKDYKAMRDHAKQCIAIYDNKDCYWRKALSSIYLKNEKQYQEDLKEAMSKGIIDPMFTPAEIYDLIAAYLALEDYHSVVKMYERLIILDTTRSEYHSSLALAYQKTGQYQKAREQALIFLKMVPEAHDQVQDFLNTLEH